MPPVNLIFSLRIREIVCGLREVGLFLWTLSSGTTEVFLIPEILYFKKIWSDWVLAIIKFLNCDDRNLAKYLLCSDYCMNSFRHIDALSKPYFKE